MIILHILVGVICTSLLFFLIYFSKHKEIEVKIWQWLIVLIEIFYIAFVLEMIVGFIEEGSARAALVMGLIFGLIAIIGAVLIGRFVFSQDRRK